ncbi:ABC-2 type transport system ATP-binding protein [Lentibacillus halodurans]|uniref:ABC-2 type transport system ATP-binding protein n=1 Tax=Lentibacillus halodurans TaxID=237679 RepID=A0A1I0XU15_9BACI|nr:ABC transporter ATP-binding protein [Lentibacillus halodurans]SFB04565.1 ABC-2 type transport system ATP-binding protein [Lentibacillus halodurans]
MPETAMELINVKKTMSNKEIIKGLSFSIHKGEVFGFIGPNGAGKTTTIRMMVGLMGLSGGDVRILGSSIKSDYKEAVREVGAIVENPEMYPFMTGHQNLMHYARMIPDVTKDRIQEVIKLVGMEKPINEKAGKYSLGMRQRLGIAQALLHKPSVLILDEPTNGLDPAGIREIRQYIRKLAKEENVAVIISSHLLSEVEQMCDRIGLIKNGEMIAIQDVNAAAEQTTGVEIQLEVAPLKQAAEILKSDFDIHPVTADHTLNIKAERETIPTIIQTFASHDIQIYQVMITKSTLEDKFFDLIGENTIE